MDPLKLQKQFPFLASWGQKAWVATGAVLHFRSDTGGKGSEGPIQGFQGFSSYCDSFLNRIGPGIGLNDLFLVLPTIKRIHEL